MGAVSYVSYVSYGHAIFYLALINIKGLDSGPIFPTHFLQQQLNHNSTDPPWDWALYGDVKLSPP